MVFAVGLAETEASGLDDTLTEADAEFDALVVLETVADGVVDCR